MTILDFILNSETLNLVDIQNEIGEEVKKRAIYKAKGNGRMGGLARKGNRNVDICKILAWVGDVEVKDYYNYVVSAGKTKRFGNWVNMLEDMNMVSKVTKIFGSKTLDFLNLCVEEPDLITMPMNHWTTDKKTRLKDMLGYTFIGKSSIYNRKRSEEMTIAYGRVQYFDLEKSIFANMFEHQAGRCNWCLHVFAGKDIANV